MTHHQNRHRVSVADHEKFRRTLTCPPPPPKPPFDVIDELAADPILDRLPAVRGGSEVGRLLAVIDSLSVDGRDHK
jgi:hypothetical protein